MSTTQGRYVTRLRDIESPQLRPQTQFSSRDFDTFDYIFAMDRSNLSDLQRQQKKGGDARAKVMLYGEFSGTGKAEVVGDPYYGGQAGFEKAFEQCSRFARNFMADVVEGS